MKAVFNTLPLLAGLLATVFVTPGYAGDRRLEVWVTIPPQAYFVEQIAGEAARVSVLAGPGRSPATYAPTAAEVARMSRADLYFGIGVPVESRLRERIRTVMNRIRFVGHEVWAPEGCGDSHATEVPPRCDISHNHACGTGPDDPHRWMDPLQMAAFVDCVRAELSRLAPEHRGGFEARAAAIKDRLEVLDRSLTARFAPHAGRAFFINHPSLGHFAARYGLEQRSLERAGAGASPRRVAEMVAEARSAGVEAVLAQVQFTRSSAEVLARTLGVPLKTLDPLGADYFRNMNEVATAVEACFKHTEREESEE